VFLPESVRQYKKVLEIQHASGIDNVHLQEMQRFLVEVRNTAGNIDARDKCYTPKALLPRTISRDRNSLCADKTVAVDERKYRRVGL
jgi:hypothetical protein